MEHGDGVATGLHRDRASAADLRTCLRTSLVENIRSIRTFGLFGLFPSGAIKIGLFTALCMNFYYTAHCSSVKFYYTVHWAPVQLQD